MKPPTPDTAKPLTPSNATPEEETRYCQAMAKLCACRRFPVLSRAYNFLASSPRTPQARTY